MRGSSGNCARPIGAGVPTSSQPPRTGVRPEAGVQSMWRRHVEPTMGRNDPCHCGSGKKYKQCCLGKDEETARAARAKAAAEAPAPSAEPARVRPRALPRTRRDSPGRRRRPTRTASEDEPPPQGRRQLGVTSCRLAAALALSRRPAPRAPQRSTTSTRRGLSTPTPVRNRRVTPASPGRLPRGQLQHRVRDRDRPRDRGAARDRGPPRSGRPGPPGDGRPGHREDRAGLSA